jgi:hypothetical protein
MDNRTNKRMNKKTDKKSLTGKVKLTQEDYYLDENGNTVFTAIFHLKRGYCCESGCRHCPYTQKK